MEPDVPGWGQGGQQAGTAVLVRRRLGCVCVGSSGVARVTLERTPGCPLPPQFSKQAPLFLQTGAAKLFTDSKICLVRRDNQAQGGTWDVPRKATSWPKICPCCPTGSSLLQASYLPPWQKPVYPEVCIQTRDKEQGRMRSFWQRKPDHEDPTIGPEWQAAFREHFLPSP